MSSAGTGAAEHRSGLSALPPLRTLHIAQFAFVMATGIISAALWLDGARPLSRLLLGVALISYVALCVLHLARLLRHRPAVLAELSGPQGFAFLAFVAATDVLSSRLGLAGHTGTAVVLLGIGVVVWLLLGYGVPLVMIAHTERRIRLDAINGTWFMWVVGTQSVAVAAAELAVLTGSPRLALLAAGCWAIGVVQYLLLSAVVLARLLLRPVPVADSVAPYWVFMGSAAITVLAGALVARHHQGAPLLDHDVVLTLSALLWAFATWLVPLLIAFGCWRAVHLRQLPAYRTEWWAAVFPVGMYGVASHELGLSAGTHWLTRIGTVGAWVALVVWVTVVAMVLARRAVR